MEGEKHLLDPRRPRQRSTMCGLPAGAGVVLGRTGRSVRGVRRGPTATCPTCLAENERRLAGDGRVKRVRAEDRRVQAVRDLLARWEHHQPEPGLMVASLKKALTA